MPEVKETYRIFLLHYSENGTEIVTEQSDSTNWRVTVKDRKGKSLFGPVYTHSVCDAGTLHGQVKSGFGMASGMHFQKAD